LFCHFAQEFGDAKEPINFFVQAICCFGFYNVQTGSVNNPQTKERLMIKQSDQDCVTISRHPIEATEEWIEGMNDKYPNEYRHIYV
jgi:hypothetical protein